MGLNLVQEALDKVIVIRERLVKTQSRQESYADRHIRGLKLSKGKKVFLKALLVKGVMRFGKNVMLSHRFIVPYEIVEHVGLVDYRLAFPPEFFVVYLVFHVSMLQQHAHDSSHMIHLVEIELDENLAFEEGPITIIERHVRKLRSKEIASVKVL